MGLDVFGFGGLGLGRDGDGEGKESLVCVVNEHRDVVRAREELGVWVSDYWWGWDRRS